EMLERANQAYGNNRHAQLLGDAEAAILKFIHVTVPRALGLGENDKARAGIDGSLRHAPHAFQIRGAPHIRHRHISEALHQPAVSGNLEVRFQFPAAHELWNGAVEHERIKQIDVVREKEAGAVRIETLGTANLDFCSREKGDAPAQATLKPVVSARVEKNVQKDEHRYDNEKVQGTDHPEKYAAEGEPRFFHRNTSTAEGRISSERHSSVATSPSIMMSSGVETLNSTWRT